MHSAGIPLEGWLGDGPQERGRRGGTENLLGLLALGEVARLGVDADPRWTGLLEAELRGVPGLQVTGTAEGRLPSHLHLRLPVRADLVLQRLDLEGFAVSSGSACSSGSLQPSRVLLAMGWSEEQARCALRVSTGWTNSHEDVTAFAATLKEVLADLMSLTRSGEPT
jgi:cysteine desulfurase